MVFTFYLARNGRTEAVFTDEITVFKNEEHD